ncbi:MAG: 50S ribosomal protein L29 [Planctomycetes bacterium]|nr:50S ribosomal protein L29 [Planctomycetota bacterium]
MKARDVRSKEDKELHYDLKNLTKELFDLRFQSASENISNSSRIGQIKRDIARIYTILHERKKGIRGEASR